MPIRYPTQSPGARTRTTASRFAPPPRAGGRRPGRTRWRYAPLLVLSAALACAPRTPAAQPDPAQRCDPCFIEVRNATSYRLDLLMGGVVGVVEPRGVTQFTVDGPAGRLIGRHYMNGQPVGRPCNFLGVRDNVRRYECRRS